MIARFGFMKAAIAFAMLSVFGTFSGFGQEIALFLGKSGHNEEFNLAFERLGWKEPDKFECSAEGMKRFAESSSKYDLVLVVPLFNYEMNGANRGKKILSKEDANAEGIKKYIRNGGVMVITDGSYANAVDWLADLDPSFGGLSTGKCTSSPWGVLGYVRNTEPVHPIRCFPNYITEGDSWPHFTDLPKGSKWTALACCSEGKPVCLYQKYGKGFVVITCLRQPNEKILENYYANCMLLKANLNVEKFTMSEFKPGPGVIDMTLSDSPPAGSSLTFEIIDSKNKRWSFSTNIVGKTSTINYVVEARGDVRTSLYLDTKAGRSVLFNRQTTLPPLFEIRPNAYRGILSTKRRLDDVDFLLKFAPSKEDLTCADVKMDFYDCASNLVFSSELTTPTNFVSDLWVPVKLPKTLSAGGYVVRASMSKENIKAKSETSFEILSPRAAQTIIDEDNTFLINGKPFFPLGIYHIAGDYNTVGDIGFNACQFWKWMISDDGYGAPLGLNKAAANKMKCLFESNHWGEDIFKDIALKYSDHPAILMWYVADEPNEGSEESMRTVRDIYYKYDKQHPTYLVSCRPDLYHIHKNYADVMAFNPYLSKNTADAVQNVIKCIKRAQTVTDGRKCLVLVPWSIPKEFDSAKYVAYAAIVHDIRGIFWYCWSQTGGGPVGIGLSQNEDYQKKFKVLLAELKLLFPGLLTSQRRMFEEGDIHGIVCPVNGANKRLAVMMNISDKSVDADFVIPEIEKVSKISDVYTDKPVTIEGGRIKRKFKPFEVLSIKW